MLHLKLSNRRDDVYLVVDSQSSAAPGLLYRLELASLGLQFVVGKTLWSVHGEKDNCWGWGTWIRRGEIWYHHYKEFVVESEKHVLWWRKSGSGFIGDNLGAEFRTPEWPNRPQWKEEEGDQRKSPMLPLSSSHNFKVRFSIVSFCDVFCFLCSLYLSLASSVLYHCSSPWHFDGVVKLRAYSSSP